MKPIRSTCVLSGLLALAACASSDSLQSDESLLRFLPEEASGVVFVDLGALRQNAFALGFMEEYVGIQVPEGLEDFTISTGFDPDSSLQQIMGASSGSGESLMVVKAVYDSERVTAYLTDEGMTHGTHGDTSLFRPDAGRDTVVAFVDDVVLVGDEPQVRDAIDRSSGSTRSALDNPQLVEDAQRIGDGYQVWATGSVDAGLIPEDLAGAGPLELLRTLEAGTYQMRVDEMVTARAVGQFADPQEAATLGTLLEGLKGMAMLQGMSGEFGQLLSAIVISNVDSTLEIRLEIETAVLERLAESGALSR